MNFQILSHASMVVRSRGKSLLVDPWLIGSCYWRSWWNYPPVRPELIEALAPDAIYLTHVHWDHFHGATLKKFPRDTLILVPFARSGRLKRDLLSIGFKNVRELPHGDEYALADDFRLTSYQFASPWGDSALVVETDGVALFNANDTKFMGSPLEHVMRRHPRFDFAFRSHSSANDRACFRYDGEDHASYREDPDMYARSFFNFMNKVQPRYAVPFASNHCHLHRDVYEFNGNIMTPVLIEEFIERQGGFTNSELKIMVSGDSWDSDTGFDIAENTFFSDRETHLERYREANVAKLDKTYAAEDKARVSLREFERFFDGFFASVPGYRRRALQGKPIVFRALAGDTREHFLVDVHAGTVRQIAESEIPENPMIYETAAFILKRALAANMFSHVGISKRVVYRIRREDEPYFKQFKQLLAAYEYEALPLNQLFSRRTLKSYLPRWREVMLNIKMAIALRNGKTLRELETQYLK